MARGKPKAGKMQGEGDYAAARRFDEEERSFVERGPVDAKAREAADALDGPEGPELESARKASARGKSLKPGKTAHPSAMPDESDAHTEEALDAGLEETFPASDPVSISPGSD